jgi:glutamate dehydrogenase/leucine dehydrogenase
MHAAQRNASNAAVATVKSVACGGLAGRAPATGQGLSLAIQEWAKYRKMSLSRLRVAVQGYGKVGSFAAIFLQDLGCRLVAAADVCGQVADPEGIDARALAQHVAATGSVVGFAGAHSVGADEFFETEAEVFIPAALANCITDRVARMLRCQVVAEGANCPTTLEGDEVLGERGIDVLPDIFANAGGVAVSYLEWLYNHGGHAAFSFEEIGRFLTERYQRNFAALAGAAEAHKVDWRTAAYMVSLRRISEKITSRGLYP